MELEDPGQWVVRSWCAERVPLPGWWLQHFSVGTEETLSLPIHFRAGGRYGAELVL